MVLLVAVTADVYRLGPRLPFVMAAHGIAATTAAHAQRIMVAERGKTSGWQLALVLVTGRDPLIVPAAGQSLICGRISPWLSVKALGNYDRNHRSFHVNHRFFTLQTSTTLVRLGLAKEV